MRPGIPVSRTDARFVGLLCGLNPGQTHGMDDLNRDERRPSPLGISPWCVSSDLNRVAAAGNGPGFEPRAAVVKKFPSFLFLFLLLVPCLSIAQDIPAKIEAMKSAYAQSGSIVAVDGDVIVIEPKMPSPICALLINKDGKTGWVYYSFPLASITVPLDLVDETLIVEDRVFTNPDAAHTYRPGDVGDTTMVVIAGEPGKQFHTLIYDREKLAQLGPGPHSSSQYGQEPDETAAFGLTFSSLADARTFEIALKDAVILAKSKKAPRQISAER
jgi:hypothetical protein